MAWNSDVAVVAACFPYLANVAAVAAAVVAPLVAAAFVVIAFHWLFLRFGFLFLDFSVGPFRFRTNFANLDVVWSFPGWGQKGGQRGGTRPCCCRHNVY